MTQMFKRRIVREKVLQILYAFELNSDALQLLTEGILADLEDDIDRKFANDLVNRIIIHSGELDLKIKERVDNWEMGRIALFVWGYVNFIISLIFHLRYL
jgi:transcription termination factor NusB